MKKSFALALSFTIFILLLSICSCNDRDNVQDSSAPFRSQQENSTIHVDGIDADVEYTFVTGEMGYTIGYDKSRFKRSAVDGKDVFSSNDSAKLEISLSDGKTVDASVEQFRVQMVDGGMTVSESKSVTVGTEYYSARYLSAEGVESKCECYFIPVENECLVLTFCFSENTGDGDKARLLAMLDTLTIA